MSPAAGAPDSLHSWVGIIMYLPTAYEKERDAITRAFREYGEKEFDALGDAYALRAHGPRSMFPRTQRVSPAIKRDFASTTP